MSLPTLTIPKYTMTIPSTKKVVQFRPFLVREQKILLMALETGDEKQILSSMCEIIRNCVDGINHPEEMPIFDIEYIFMKIRAKSVGESVDVKLKCPNCQVGNDTSVNIDAVEVVFDEKANPKLMLTDTIGMILNYPCLKDAVLNIDAASPNEIIEYVAKSIHTIFDGDMVYSKKDFTIEEAVKFIESMTAGQMEKVSYFYNHLPSIKKEIECKCVNCKNDFKISFGGMRDFFT